MKNKLITALRLSANALENGTFPYDWKSCAQCNCGVLACSLTGHTPSSLPVPKSPNEDGEGTWTLRAGYHCPITGMPEHKILRAMFDAGMTLEDVKELEYLSNPKVVDRLQKTGKTWTFTETVKPWFRKSFTKQTQVKDKHKWALPVAEYMRAWADLLQEEGRDDQPEKASTVCVTGVSVV